MIRDMELVRLLLDELANGKEEYELIVNPENFNQPDHFATSWAG